jgi:hypothetical protein
MPGLQLYQTELDELELVKAAIDEGCWLVPDSHYKVHEPDRLFTMEEFRDARLEQRHFFILNEVFIQSPISMREISKLDEHYYYVSPNVGGPSLEFLGGGISVDDRTGEKLIGSGFLEFSREYWVDDLSRKKPSPPELEEMYKRLARVVKVQSTRIKPGKGVFWLGNDARMQLEKGARLVGYESWSQHSQASMSAD